MSHISVSIFAFLYLRFISREFKEYKDVMYTLIFICVCMCVCMRSWRPYKQE